MKKIFNTKTIVAIGLGAALFTVLHAFVKIPSPIPNTSIQAAYGIAAFFGALFGPIASGLIAFIGHAISDAVQYGSIWWSWVIASGVACTIMGAYFFRNNVEEGVFTTKDLLQFNVIQIIGNAIAWFIVAPGLDILIYAEPANLVFVQGAWAGFSNMVTVGIIGSLLLFAYSKTRTKQGSLSKEK